MKKSQAILSAVALLLTVLVWTFWPSSKAAAPLPAKNAASARPRLSPLEKRVLLNIEDLRRDPAAAAFAQDLQALPGLAHAVEEGMGAGDLARFKSLVAKHASNPAFAAAAKDPQPAGKTKDPDSCAGGAAPAALPALGKPAAKKNYPVDDGCAEGAAPLRLFPGSNP